jgi:VTC domain
LRGETPGGVCRFRKHRAVNGARTPAQGDLERLSDTSTVAGSESRVTRLFASEIKFVLDPATAARIREWARARLEPDPFGDGAVGDEYLVTSLYFDTDDLDVYHRRGSYARGKYRARRYGSADVLFLERKLRSDYVLSKRRTMVALDHLAALDANPLVDGGGRWFHKRLIVRGLAPSCQIAYHRIARQVASPYGPMRLTIDDRLAAQRALNLELVDSPGSPMAPGRLILELKFRVHLPAIFKELIETFALSPARISKYRLAMDALRGRPLGGPETRDPAAAALSCR